MRKAVSKKTKHVHHGEFYTDYDDKSGLYCIFHTETGDYAYECYSSKDEALVNTARLNRLNSEDTRKNPLGLCPSCGVTLANPLGLKKGRCPQCRRTIRRA